MALACIAGPALAAPADAKNSGDWSTYGHDKGGQRHSPLTQITPANVGALQPAWVYHMKPAALPTTQAAPSPPDPNHIETAAPTPPKFLPSQMTPLVAGGRMYITTPYGRAAALDATTGKQLWTTMIGETSAPSYRGVEYWAGDRATPARIVFGTGDGRLIALDAATGAFVKGFGENGVVNLKTPEVMNGLPNAQYRMTTPPLITGNLIVTGSRVQESPTEGASGDVRAWDVRTGALVWTFHTIPRKGEPNYGTWAEGSDVKRSGVNVWGFMTVDEPRGILYLPVAGATYDRYGGDRPGNSLYTSSLVAVNAKTGKYLWHFQLVHHDIWDIDMQSAPLLFDAKIGGRTIPAVSITNKTAMVYMFNRVTGKPLRPIVEKPFPKSDAPGEVAAPTQPIPTTPPLARNSFKFPDDIADVTPELKAFCTDLFTSKNMKGTVQYEPYPFDRPGVHFPGTEGGASWSGQTFDPKTGYVFIQTNNVGLVTQLVKSDLPPGYRTVNSYFRQEGTRMECAKPPWSQLSAVDTATGKIAWQIPLGVTDGVPEAVRNTGRAGHGGAITTDSGLLFIGNSDDQRFRAFDTKTGKQLWETKLEASAHATPITYRGADGRQYVTITATGGTYFGTPVTADDVIAFALPK
jgi:quinoprotein glucose dehydrogenase